MTEISQRKKTACSNALTQLCSESVGHNWSQGMNTRKCSKKQLILLLVYVFEA